MLEFHNTRGKHMRGEFRAGHLFGISIRIDWSLLIMFLLITWTLGASFYRMQPEWGPIAPWVMSAVAALLFFTSILLHELAHSLMARAQGIPVRNITLFLFGGVSNIQRDPPSPRAEFLITVVGPLTSLALGISLLLAVCSSVGPLIEGSPLAVRLGPVAAVLSWLGSINILLALFNLIPGFPLDGGRILRSILWAQTHNLRRATRLACRIGQGIAWVMIAAGALMVLDVTVPLFGRGITGGLWLIFLGWFLNNAAVQNNQGELVYDVLEEVRVADVMRTDPPTVPPDLSIDRLMQGYVLPTEEYAYLVMDDKRLLGMVTLKDIRAIPSAQWAQTLIRDVMTQREQLVTVDPEEDAAAALDILMDHGLRQLPVARDGQLFGLIRRHEIFKWLQLRSVKLT
jgi:Zn-dependent protease/CBS domain-containing protein